MKIVPKQLAACASVAALSAVGLFGAVAQTQQATPKHDRFMSEIETVLAMTPQQKDQVRTAFRDARQSAAPIRQELRQTNKALEAAIKSDDTSQIQRLSSTEGQEIGQLMAIRGSAFAKVYNTLNPDQKTKAEALEGILHREFHQQMNHSGMNRRAQANS